MVVFIDTSALSKRYVEEDGSASVDSYFASNNIIGLAPTTPIEIRSVLSRRKRERSLSAEVFESALSEWLKEEPEFQIESFSPQLRKEAIEIVETSGIKTLDAIQLGAARLAGAEVFVTSDKALAAAAQASFSGAVVFIGNVSRL